MFNETIRVIKTEALDSGEYKIVAQGYTSGLSLHVITQYKPTDRLGDEYRLTLERVDR